jgi:hypothetical protein
VPIDPKSLPQDPAILQQMLVDLTAQLDKTNKLLRQLLEAKHHTKSEQLSPDQLRLFIEELKKTKAAAKDDDELPPPDAGSGQAEGQEDSRPRGRRPLPPHLKRQRIEHDLSAEEKHCADCQQDLHLLGEETSERYEYIPAQFLVIEDCLQEVRVPMHGKDSHQAAATDCQEFGRSVGPGASDRRQDCRSFASASARENLFAVWRRHSGPDDGRVAAPISGVALAAL